MVVEKELEKLKRFRQFLRSEDKEIFDDLLNQCRLYASYGSTMALPVNEIPLLMSMLFGQHKRLVDLERRIKSIESYGGPIRQNDNLLHNTVAENKHW